MGYVRRHLMPGEEVIHVAGLHPIIFGWPALAAIGAVAALIAWAAGIQPARWGAAVLGLAAVVLAVAPLARFLSTEFALTTKRLIVKSGVLHVHSLDTLLTKVEAVAIDQGLAGRILDFGTVTITGTGGTKESFHGIRRPAHFRMKVQQQIDGSGRGD